MRPRLTSAEMSRNAFLALVASWCGAVLVEFVDIFILTLIRDPLVELLDRIEDRVLKPRHCKKSVASVFGHAVPVNIAVM
jgi:hypothetical protein